MRRQDLETDGPLHRGDGLRAGCFPSPHSGWNPNPLGPGPAKTGDPFGPVAAIKPLYDQPSDMEALLSGELLSRPPLKFCIPKFEFQI